MLVCDRPLPEWRENLKLEEEEEDEEEESVVEELGDWESAMSSRMWGLSRLFFRGCVA